MKLQKFTYTKATGEVSKREILVMTEPTNLVAGISVSDMPAENFASFAAELRKLKNEYEVGLTNLLATYDLKHDYRQFKPSGMSDVQSEYI